MRSIKALKLAAFRRRVLVYFIQRREFSLKDKFF